MSLVNREKTVLIVTYGFLPHNKSLGGVIRMLRLAEYLQNKKCKVYVLSASNSHNNSFGYDKLLKSLNIIYVPDRFALATGSSGNDVLEKKEQSLMASLKGWIKLKLKPIVLELLTPDAGIFVVSQMVSTAAELIKSNPKITVITSGPPHSVHLVGSSLKKQFGSINWIVDYRDSWNGTSLFRKKHKVLQKINERFEKSTLSSCDSFSYISPPMLKKAQVYSRNVSDSNSFMIRNGFDIGVLNSFKDKPLSKGPLKIGYFGAIDTNSNGYRNPDIILNVLINNPNLDLKLEFFGAVTISERWQRKLAKRIHIGSNLSHRDALQKMNGMDALLLLHTREEGADEVLTGKVFEYIATGLPIIAIGPKNMAVVKMLEGDNGFFIASHTNSNEILSVFEKLVALKKKSLLPLRNRSNILQFSRDQQYKQFFDLV